MNCDDVVIKLRTVEYHLSAMESTLQISFSEAELLYWQPDGSCVGRSSMVKTLLTRIGERIESLTDDQNGMKQFTEFDARYWNIIYKKIKEL